MIEDQLGLLKISKKLHEAGMEGLLLDDSAPCASSWKMQHSYMTLTAMREFFPKNTSKGFLKLFSMYSLF